MNVAAQRPLDVDLLRSRLERLYGEQADAALQLLLQRISRFENQSPSSVRTATWDQTDVVLITYGNQIAADDGNTKPLEAFLGFLSQWQLPDLINTIHFLPFFPYSSDDGFSVIDYRAVDPELGDWADVRRIGQECRLMFDFVVNHCSQQSPWFQGYRNGTAPFDRFFIEVDPQTDVTQVTRPRSLPLLHEFETSRGPKFVWTTFSRDQVDLNYAEPELLAEVVDILLEYVQHGARIIRLDAIAYLWKELGTPCIHLPQTHEVVKLFRQVLESAAPHVLLLTETNVPHDENVSYFGTGDEAHMVYQFSLPPLLLDAFLHYDARPLQDWLAQWTNPPAGATYVNFTASHDGVGLRPLEGQVDAQRLQSLVSKIQQRGGHVSTRRQADGSESPYELNISYFDALADDTGDLGLQLRRFLASQAIMLSLQGMPAIYFHSLVGTPNDHEGVAESSIPRRINRRKYTQKELNALLNSAASMQQRVFHGVQDLLTIRIRQPAFHPDATQRYVAMDSEKVVAFERRCQATGQHILVAVNFGDVAAPVNPPTDYRETMNLLGDVVNDNQGRWVLEPAEVIWMKGAHGNG